MKTAQLVTIVTATALVVPIGIAIIIGDPIPFIPVVISQLSLTDVAEAVWGYSGRTLGRIDTLTFDIWNHSVQVLADHTTVEASKDLTDQPVIEIVSDPVPDLSNKLDSTAPALDQLSLDYQKVASEVGLMGLKWTSLQGAEAIQSLDELISALGSDDQMIWLTKAWGWPQLSTIASLVSQAKDNLVSVRQTASTTGLQPVAYLQLKSALKNLELVQGLVGGTQDTVNDQTVYGQYKQAQEATAVWDSHQEQLTDLLTQWNTLPSDQMENKISSATSVVLAQNRIPNASQFLATAPKNKILDLIELIQVNKSLLAQDAGTPVIRTWLEEDPLVVKTLVTNSSSTAQRSITVKYYLPAEIKEPDILAHDVDLEVKYDSQREQYYLMGNLALAATDTKVLTAQITNLWPLGQIDAALQDQIITPEQRITAFRRTSRKLTTATQKGSVNNLLNLTSVEEPLGIGIAMVVIGVLLFVLASPARHTTPLRQFQAFSPENISSSDL